MTTSHTKMRNGLRTETIKMRGSLITATQSLSFVLLITIFIVCRYKEMRKTMAMAMSPFSMQMEVCSLTNMQVKSIKS